jgi:hypothetical protein
MRGFTHLFLFNLRRILSLRRTHVLMLLMLCVLAFFLGHVSGPAPDPAHIGAVISMFCGNFLVFNSLMLAFLLAENVFFLEKNNRIMEAVFSSPVGHGTVVLSKAAALSLVAWVYPVLVLGAVLAVHGGRFIGAVSAAHLALMLAVMPAFLFGSALITGIFLLLARDIRVKNLITSAVLFAVMGLSKTVMAVSKASGFLPVLYAYIFISSVFLIFAFVVYRTLYNKAAVLSSSY